MIEDTHIKNKIKLLTFVWAFFIVELIVFFALTYLYLAPEKISQSINPFDIAFLYISYMISIISIPAVFKIYDILKKKNKQSASDKLKVEKYQIAIIIKYAILEIAALSSLIAFYLNETNEPLYMFGIVFVAVLLNKPSNKQFEKDFFKNENENLIEEIVYLPDEVKELKTKNGDKNITN